MIDIHCHILFGSDDGADSIAESLEMAKLAYSGGTKKIIATPHTNVPDSYKNLWDENFENKVRQLNLALEEADCPLTVYPGQEVFCSRNFIQLLNEGKLITLNHSRYLLVEFGFYEASSTVYEKVERLRAEGVVPIVSHPERYAFVWEDDTAAHKLKTMGCLLQVNKGSLSGDFGRKAYKAAKHIMRKNDADFVASDAHSPYVRTPYLERVYNYVAERYSFDYAEWLFSSNPACVLKDKTIVPF